MCMHVYIHLEMYVNACSYMQMHVSMYLSVRLYVHMYVLYMNVRTYMRV